MKSLISWCLLLCTTTTITTTTRAQCPSLLWSDEFDGTDLDETKWSTMVGDGCDLGICGWGNNEWQSYQAGESNLEVSDGTLKIHARYESDSSTSNDDPAATQHKPATYQYTSARLRSLARGDFDMAKPLFIEARMKVPKNSKGLWPAFWMMPSQMEMSTWPLGGEVDILEFIGREPNHTHGYMHYGLKWNDKSQKGGPIKLPEHAGEDFHLFGLEKTPNSMSWYIDGHKFQTYTKDDVEPKFEWPYENVFHFIINLAIGGNWPEYPDATTTFPNTFEVDYVRVYDLETSNHTNEHHDVPIIVPHIEGDTLVRRARKNIKYCINVGTLVPHADFDSFIQWTVPDDATYTTIDDDDDTDNEDAFQDQPTCILVDFGRASGYIQAKMFLTCGRHYQFRLPVEVQNKYKAEFTLLGPDLSQDQASYEYSTGTYEVMEAADMGPSTIVYQRQLEEVYDHIHLKLQTEHVIPDPNLYVESAKKFYMDAFSVTAAPCTRIYIQLEDSHLATPDNYPTGRHSRYIAFLQKDTIEYQRLEFDFYDVPDIHFAGTVDRLVILPDSFEQRADVYYFRNLVSAAAGCTIGDPECEVLSTNTCRHAAKSEWGACTDGFNNDGYGYNGDAPMDCDDSDCWDDPACQGQGTTPTHAPTLPQVEICHDGIDNDHNGYTDCEDLACAGSKECGSWHQPECSAYSLCAVEGHVGDCCPTALGEYKECCTNDTPASCSVNPSCSVLGLTGDCCPTLEGAMLSCCEPDLCFSNPQCSGLDGTCCPTDEGVFLECCEERPETCVIHPQCDALGLAGQCCPTPDGVFLDCCEPSECAVHPACAALNLADDCCPTQDGLYLDCCNLDMPYFEGFTGRVVQTSLLEAMPEMRQPSSLSASASSSKPATQLAFGALLCILLSLFLLVQGTDEWNRPAATSTTHGCGGGHANHVEVVEPPIERDSLIDLVYHEAVAVTTAAAAPNDKKYGSALGIGK